jgi:putative ABC transport system permease protein
VSIASAVAAVLGAAVVAGVLAARSATGGTAQAGLTRSRTGTERMSRKRIAGGSVLLLLAAGYSALTVTVMADSADPYAAMSTAGPASVFWSIGLAVLAPALLRAVAVLATPLLRLSGSRTAPHLVLAHVRRRSHDLAGVLMPVLVFVGISTGTLYLMQIESRTSPVSGVTGANLALVNYLVVGMIAVFAAIMAVNGTVAAVADRRREYALQRLAGLTRAELTTVAAIEASAVVAAAVLFGGLAALGTVVPYSVVKTDGWLSVSGPGWFLGVCAVAALVAVGTAVGATRRATAGPALRPQPV